VEAFMAMCSVIGFGVVVILGMGASYKVVGYIVSNG
jgi:hypothetical protein